MTTWQFTLIVKQELSCSGHRWRYTLDITTLMCTEDGYIIDTPPVGNTSGRMKVNNVFSDFLQDLLSDRNFASFRSGGAWFSNKSLPELSNRSIKYHMDLRNLRCNLVIRSATCCQKKGKCTCCLNTDLWTLADSEREFSSVMILEYVWMRTHCKFSIQRWQSFFNQFWKVSKSVSCEFLIRLKWIKLMPSCYFASGFGGWASLSCSHTVYKL